MRTRIAKIKRDTGCKLLSVVVSRAVAITTEALVFLSMLMELGGR